MPAGPISATNLAATTVGGAAETNWLHATLGSKLLLPGTNILAVEVHQAAPNSSDIGFDLELTATLQPELTISRTPTNYVLRWPLAAPGFHVQSTNILNGATNWPALAVTTRTNGSFFEAPISLSAPRFFRLVAP